ncbi:MAG: TolC family protein, partial [Muribaculaceae bacterium]|nr:TolC family protein [Muribaculaceae bacterium]
ISLISATAIMNAGKISPEEATRIISAGCPALKSLRSANEAAALEMSAETNLPDPEVEGEFLAAPKGVENRWGAGISWGFDWPGLYSARKGKVRGEIDRLTAQENLAVKNTVNEIRRLILDYILQTNRINVLKGIEASNDTVADLAAKANKGGEMTLLDMNKIRLETASLEVRLSTLISERQSTVGRLSAIAGKDCQPILEEMECVFPESGDISESELREGIGKSREMELAKSEINAASLGRKVAKMESLPSLSIGYRHAFEDGNHFNGGSLGFSLPLFSGRGKGKAAKAALEAANLAAEQIRYENESSGIISLRQLDLLKKEIAAVAPLLESADSNTLLLKAYRSGVITLIDYLVERNYYTEAAMQLLEMRYAAASLWLDIVSLTE